MSTWIDTKPEHEVRTAIDALVEKGMWTQYIDYANGDERFALWLRLVDRRVQRMTKGVVTMFDLADWNSRDTFDAGCSPAEGVDAIADYDDMFASWMAETEYDGSFI